MRKLVIITLVTILYCGCSNNDAEINQSAEALITQGKKYQSEGNFFDALSSYFNASRKFKQTNNLKQVAYTSNKIGQIYDLSKYYNPAAAFYKEALDIRLQLSDTLAIGKSYYNIGRIYRFTGNPTKSIEYYNLALDKYRLLADTIRISKTYNDIGIVLMNNTKYDSARYYFNKSLYTYPTTDLNYLNRKGMLFNNIGYSYLDEGRKSHGISYLHKALKLIDHLTDNNKVLVYQNFALSTSNIDSAAVFYEKSLKYVATTSDLYIEATNALFHYYMSIDDYSTAVAYHNMGYEATKELAQQQKQFKEMYDHYQVEAAHFKEQLIRKSSLLSTRNQIDIWSAIALISFAFGVMIYTYRNEQKIKKEAMRLTAKLKKHFTNP